MENREYWQGVSSKSLVQRFGKHASQTQDCTLEQRAEEKRKIAEFVRVRGVVAIRQGKVAGQCVMPYTLRWPVWSMYAIQWVAEWGFWSSTVDETGEQWENNAARIVLQAPRWCHANPLPRQLHRLPVHHRFNKLAVMTYKIHSTGLPAYLSHHINPRETTVTLYVHLTLYCSPYHSPGPSLRSVPSDAQLHLSRTHYLHSSPTVALWRPSNLGWKLTFFRLPFDCSVHVWPHHIPASASEVTTLWRYI